MRFDCEIWLIWWILLSTWTRSEGLNNTCDKFYLLNLYPAPDESNSRGFDKGLELIPAGHLATRHINSDPSILQGRKIELIDVPTEACEQTLIIEGLTNYYEQVLSPVGACIYGIVGLYCSTVTNIIAPIASHPNIGYIQLAASTSPAHRDVTRFPFTFHTISSTRVLNRAVVQLMEEFNWRRVVSVFNSLSIYHQSTAINFKNLMTNSSLTSIALVPSFQTSKIFDILVDQERRIGYISATDKEIAAFFCEAHKRRFLWPNYAYIVVESSIPGVLNYQTDCSIQDLNTALEGTFLLRYRLQNYEGQYLDISRRMYEQYLDEYTEELNGFAMKKNVTLKANPYADTLYDQVWAIALALNASLDDFSHSVSQTNFKDRALTRAILAENMKEVEFIGASGAVRFKDNEVSTPVEIYQIQNGVEVLIGTYDSLNSVINFTNNLNRSIVPDDTFGTETLFAPLWMTIIVIIASIAILLLTLFNTAAIIFLKNTPELKSGSVSLSLVILLGSCVLGTSSIFSTVLVTAVRPHSTFLCNLKFWTFILGIVLILSTLFWRLLRTFHIFRSFKRTGKCWSDKYLILYLTLTCSVALAILITWALLDPLYYVQEDPKFTLVNSNPKYTSIFSCSCKHLGIWLALIFSFIGCIMILLVFFAIQTRHIHIKHFKDTKKMNIFIFSVCIIYAIFVPLWLILSELGFQWVAYLCQSIATLAGAALCQVLLLLPKTIPAIYNCARS